MAKINKPLLSLSAIGALGKHLIFRKRGLDTVVQQRPLAVDARTSAQLQWRTMYQKAVALWHLLSPAEKAAWERQATPRHMIGFAYFISQALKPNPGIYLPLAGGAMSGNIDMATNKILNLPSPTAGEEPTRKVDLATHAGMQAAIHGLKGEVGFSVWASTQQWISTSTNEKVNFNIEDYDLGSYFHLTTETYTPLKAGKYLFIGGITLLGLDAADQILLYLFKNGSVFKCFGRHSPAAIIGPCINGSCIAEANGTTDHFRLYVYHNHVSDLLTRSGEQWVYFQGHLIPQT